MVSNQNEFFMKRLNPLADRAGELLIGNVVGNAGRDFYWF